jgi:hypothetical protein
MIEHQRSHPDREAVESRPALPQSARVGSRTSCDRSSSASVFEKAAARRQRCCSIIAATLGAALMIVRIRRRGQVVANLPIPNVDGLPLRMG